MAGATTGTSLKKSESQEQQAYFDWVRIKAKQDERYENIVAIPNQGGSGIQNIIRGQKMRREGSAKGFPDVGIFISDWADRSDVNWYGAFLEFKIKPNKQSNEQKDWQKRLEKAGYFYRVVYSAEEAIEATESYLGKISYLK